MTLIEWIQDCALDDKPAVVFSSSAGAQSHPLFGMGTKIFHYEEWAGIQKEFLYLRFIEGQFPL